MFSFYRIFKVKPSSGILKGEFQLIVIEMTPKEAKVYSRVLNYQLISTAAVHSKVSSIAPAFNDRGLFLYCIK